MKALSIVMGILYAIIGILCISRPAFTAGILAYIIAFAFIVSGIWMIVSYFTSRDNFGISLHSGWTLAYGIISCISGVLMIIWPVMTNIVLAEILILLIVISGILKIVSAYNSHKLGSPWGWTLFFGILITVCGIFLLFHPLIGVISIGLAIGISLLIQGINFIILGCSI